MNSSIIGYSLEDQPWTGCWIILEFYDVEGLTSCVVEMLEVEDTATLAPIEEDESDDWRSYRIFANRTESGNGGWCDPEHGLSLGPCLWIVPYLLCSWRVAEHTLHFPHFLLAPSDNDQVCECGAAGNTQLFDGDLLTGIRVDDLVCQRETASSLAVLVAILSSHYCYWFLDCAPEGDVNVMFCIPWNEFYFDLLFSEAVPVVCTDGVVC